MVAACHTCQLTKTKKVKYGKLPEKEAEIIPWDTLCIDLIGPYKLKQPNKKMPLELWALTMIDPATGWFDMVPIETKRADIIANKLEQAWLTKYPWRTKVVLDRGTEFMAEVKKRCYVRTTTSHVSPSLRVTRKPMQYWNGLTKQ